MKSKIHGIWAYFSTFSRVWAFIWKPGSGSGSECEWTDPDPLQIKIRIRIPIPHQDDKWNPGPIKVMRIHKTGLECRGFIRTSTVMGRSVPVPPDLVGVVQLRVLAMPAAGISKFAQKHCHHSSSRHRETTQVWRNNTSLSLNQTLTRWAG